MFGESGTIGELHAKYGLSPEHIVMAVKELLKLKRC